MPATGQEPGCTRARAHHPVVAFQECIQKRIEEGQYKAKYKMIVEEEEIILVTFINQCNGILEGGP